MIQNKLEVLEKFNLFTLKIEYKRYVMNGELHNPNGPAFISYYANGNVHCEEYWIDGKTHNSNGSAVRTYSEDGLLLSEQYWFNNIYFPSLKEFKSGVNMRLLK